MASATAFSGSRLGRRVAFSSNARSSLVVRAATVLPKQFKSVKPVGDRVLVRVDKEESKSVGGVLLPSSARSKPTAGTIVSVGDVTLVKEGDKVIYSKFAGTELQVDGGEVVLLKEDDVIGVLPGTDKIASLRPVSDRVLIKSAKPETKTAGGILLNSESADKPTFGVVVAVGDGKKDEESGEVKKPNVTVGATVMYSKYSGSEFEEDDSDYIVVREGDILAALA